MSFATTEVNYTDFADESNIFGRNSVAFKPSVFIGLQDFIQVLRLLAVGRPVGTLKYETLGRKVENFTMSEFSLPAPSQAFVPKALEETNEQLDELARDLTEGHIPADELHPEAIAQAREFIERYYYSVKEFSLDWRKPHVAVEDHRVSFDWWKDPKTLAFFVGDHGNIDFLKAWGAHMWNDMDDGSDPSTDELIEFWKWLIE